MSAAPSVAVAALVLIDVAPKLLATVKDAILYVSIAPPAVLTILLPELLSTIVSLKPDVPKVVTVVFEPIISIVL